MNTADSAMQMWLYVAFLFLLVALFGFLTYLSWLVPEKFRSIIQFYAQFHRKWNPEQFAWMQTRAFESIMRLLITLGFFLAIGVTAFSLLKIP